MSRLRELAERPVAPEVARAIVSLALLVTVGLGCLVAVGVGGHGDPVVGGDHAHAPVGSVVPIPARPTEAHTDSDTAPTARRRQDPQDRPGTPAHRRARRELATHRALQHLPWHHAGVTVRLVGARGGRAVLRVRATTLPAAHLAWRRLLGRFHDPGRAYLPRFSAARAGRPQATAQATRQARAVATPSGTRRAGPPHGSADPRDPNMPRYPRHKKADHR